ncbi:MAG: creatininase family protein [Rhodothermaceae bacterium]|nr:creatininase family protein [Rhodothermaceae bacterium]
MNENPCIISKTTWKTVQNTKYEVAVLPWGATEVHNYHLPYATDTIQCDHIAADATRFAWEAGVPVAVLPTVPFGVQTAHAGIPFCINMNPSTQAAVLADVARSLDSHGIKKLVILNGHGGNNFRQMIRELQPQVSIFLCTLDWYKMVDPGPFFDEPGDHAGELETSVMMHYAPQLVRPLSEAGNGHEYKSSIEAFRRGWAWAPRQWSKISDDTGVGNPAKATPDKGKAFAQAVAERTGKFLIDLAAADPENIYEKS